MSSRKNSEMKQSFYPFQFILKEGPEFDKNYLNYSLLMLQINNEILTSPKKKNQLPMQVIPFSSAQRIAAQKTATP